MALKQKKDEGSFMGRKYCADCGTGLESNGTCPNCHEEKWIFENQQDGDYRHSQEFMDEVARQSKQISVAPEDSNQ